MRGTVADNKTIPRHPGALQYYGSVLEEGLFKS
jgi:hypothetical protein